jgi:ABC-type Na+ transport system ATPase subunit NatA
VTKRFGDLVGVYDLSFAIKQGHFLGIFGLNGSGKHKRVAEFAVELRVAPRLYSCPQEC